MKRPVATAILAGALSIAGINLAAAQSNQYLGEIRLFGYNWCPSGWMVAGGQLLAINQYTALFSLYGTSFGGNGTTNFALPNLYGRAPYGLAGGGMGQAFGALYGQSTVSLLVSNLPPHTHQLNASSGANAVNSPAGALSSTYSNSADKVYTASGAPADRPMSPAAIGITGSGVPVTVQSPALSLNWCVAMVGVFPSRP